MEEEIWKAVEVIVCCPALYLIHKWSWTGKPPYLLFNTRWKLEDLGDNLVELYWQTNKKKKTMLAFIRNEITEMARSVKWSHLSHCQPQFCWLDLEFQLLPSWWIIEKYLRSCEPIVANWVVWQTTNICWHKLHAQCICLWTFSACLYLPIDGVHTCMFPPSNMYFDFIPVCLHPVICTLIPSRK